MTSVSAATSGTGVGAGGDAVAAADAGGTGGNRHRRQRRNGSVRVHQPAARRHRADTCAARTAARTGRPRRPAPRRCRDPLRSPTAVPLLDAGPAMCTKDSRLPGPRATAREEPGAFPGFYCRTGCIDRLRLRRGQDLRVRRSDRHLHHRDVHGRRRLRAGPPLRVVHAVARMPVDRVRLPDADGPVRRRRRLPRDAAVLACRTGDASARRARCVVGRPFLVGDEDRLAPLDARSDWIGEPRSARHIAPRRRPSDRSSPPRGRGSARWSTLRWPPSRASPCTS